MTSPESRVLRQLVEAILFEGIVSHSVATSRQRRRFTFVLGPYSIACEGVVGAFGRVRVDPTSIQRTTEREKNREVTWRDVASNLPARAEVRRALSRELEDTVRFCAWNAAELGGAETSRHELPYELLESRLDEGHPYHPCFKARTGFSLADHRDYGPEANRRFQLQWLAVDNQRLRQAPAERAPDFWRSELGGESWHQLCARLALENISWDTHTLVPVHPWQLARLAPNELAPRIAEREVVALGALGDLYSATQSVRTLQNAVNPRRAHVKLSLDVRITSASRTLPPESVAVAPAISRWLQRAVAADEFYATQSELVILAEYAGVHYSPGARGEGFASQVAALWREPVRRHLRPGEDAVPFNALATREAHGTPFIDGWIARHGLARWVERLIEVSVLPVWHLLCHHGIAVEAHAQNMILIHEGGWPARIALRDFHDSVEYVPEFLRDASELPAFERIHAAYAGAPDDRYHRMSSVEALRELVMDTLFVFNLSELSWLLECRYGHRERDFWRAVQACLQRYASSRWADPERSVRLNHRAQLIRTESLLTKRLNARRGAEWHHIVPNSLYTLEEDA